MDSINSFNINADSKAYGKWAEFNKEYFANPKIIDEFYSFLKEKITFKDPINLIEFGSAEGLVGEYFARMLKGKNKVSLTILDIVQEHLDVNKNPSTKKVCKDLLEFDEVEKYDLGIVVSLLHYFSKENQLVILKKIHGSLKKSGFLLLKVFVQNREDKELFHKLNELVGKKLQILDKEELEKLFRSAGFEQVNFLGDATTWNCSLNNLEKRYGLSEEMINEMISIIQETPENKKKGFKVEENKYSIPIPYKVYLLKES